jgi:Mn2+/Fe2+ NRAMP family transporter
LMGPSAMAMVAILGTTISPYLCFWRAGQEVEEQHRHHAKPLCITPKTAGPELAHIRLDTIVGMAFNSLVPLAIVFATAATLHSHGIVDVATSAQAAEALRLNFRLFQQYRPGRDVSLTKPANCRCRHCGGTAGITLNYVIS